MTASARARIAEALAERNRAALSVRGDGHVDEAPALQAYLDRQVASGVPVTLPAGTFTIRTGLTYRLNAASLEQGVFIRGAGVSKTIIDNQTSGPAITIDGTHTAGLFNYQLSGEISDLQIRSSTATAGSVGISVRAWWGGTIRRVRIREQASHGIVMRVTESNDGDNLSWFTVADSMIGECDGWAIYYDGADNAISNGFFRSERNYLRNCKAGGIAWLGQRGAIVDCGIYNCGSSRDGAQLVGGSTYVSNPTANGHGILVRDLTATGQSLLIEGCEIQGCGATQIKLQKLINAEVRRCLLRSDDTDANGTFPTKTIEVDSVTNFRATHNSVRVYSAGAHVLPVHTAYSITANASTSRISDTYWQNFPANGVRFADAGTRTSIRDEGQERKSALKFTSTTVSSGTFTPSLEDGPYQRCVVNASGTTTIALPTGYGVWAAGRELIFDVLNNTGGAVTIAMASGYVASGYASPASSKRRTARFVATHNPDEWLQVGAWSPDI